VVNNVTIDDVAARAGVSAATVSQALNRPARVSASTRRRVLEAISQLGYIPERESAGRVRQKRPESAPVTIYEVAERAGVSIATVSHALNRPGRVGASTRERVLDVIDEMGFTPKPTAVTLARKGVGRIGVVAPFTSYASYLMRLMGVLEACAARNVDVVVFDVPSVAAAMSPLLRTLPVTGRLDGLLIMGVPLEDAMARRLSRRKLATVLVDSLHKGLGWVNVDDEAGGYQVGTHLIERGHRSFTYVSEGQRSTEYTSPAQLRMHGILRAFGEADLSEDALRHWIVPANDMPGGREAAAAILRLADVPAAVIAHHDGLAAGLLAGFRAAGCRVPEDIAVVGYDGTDLAQALELTTVDQPFEETGRIAATLLLGQLDGTGRPNQQVNLTPTLIVRATS
jgi:DNA-binding LacI/PurR family transcriptional regulator